ncbi:hypothetical protein PISMIDRAFT_683785 [Pisolithus microcarpus 441]|uniref:Uncharacterized protein n=1 Tax=Pisolithus microcarpus 441 TaxID=765257 RepID=A0A0C9Y223_9AGAM|nr:hypothetical protein PISMIDRAFT_683785 [Pisolithus microcarpus 441]
MEFGPEGYLTSGASHARSNRLALLWRLACMIASEDHCRMITSSLDTAPIPTSEHNQT